jgi:hypothetical protein
MLKSTETQWCFCSPSSIMSRLLKREILFLKSSEMQWFKIGDARQLVVARCRVVKFS